MVSYSNAGYLEPSNGDPSYTDTWASGVVNPNSSMIDQNINGILTKSVAGSSNVVLTYTQGAVDEQRNANFIFTGILTGNIYVLWPSGVNRIFSVTNSTTGSFTLSCGVNDGASAPIGTTVAVAQGNTVILRSNGTNVSAISSPVGYATFTGPTSAHNYTLPDADATIACTNQQNSFSKQQYFAQATLTDAASISWDLQTGQSATVTLGGNRTLSNPTNAVAGATYLLRVKQDATGSRTLAYGNNYKWPSGVAPTLTTTANAVDLLSFYYDGTNMLGVSQLNFS